MSSSTQSPIFFEHYSVQTNVQGSPVILSKDGTGVTYRGIDTKSGDSVIIRVFSDRLLSDSSVQKDFVNRARLLIELDHPYITRIMDTGQYGSQFFYVLEDPGGETVHDLVKQRPFEVGQALQLHLQLLEALIAVRSQPGLLSRVWPRNLMIVNGQQLKIHLIAQNLVSPVAPFEDPEFLAPEVLMGQSETAQSTLYSIGATLYYMVTGRAPFETQANLNELLEAKEFKTPDFSVLPTAAPVTLITQLMERDPRMRPKSLLEWDRMLQRFIRFSPSTSPKPSPLTGPIAVSSGAGVQVAPTAKPLTPTPPAVLTEETSIKKALEDAKAHTQRLSIELTKRVQKELALSEQLKGLEDQLERERLLVEQLREQTAQAPSRKEADTIRLEWEKLETAKRQLDQEKEAFREKTQRFSLTQLGAEAAQLEEKASLVETGKRLLKTAVHRVKPVNTEEETEPTPRSVVAAPTKKPEISAEPSLPVRPPVLVPSTGVAPHTQDMVETSTPAATPKGGPSPMTAMDAARRIREKAANEAPRPTTPPFAKPNINVAPFQGEEPTLSPTTATPGPNAKPSTKSADTEPTIADTGSAIAEPLQQAEPSTAPTWNRPGTGPDRHKPIVLRKRPAPEPPSVEPDNRAWLALAILVVFTGLTLYLLPYRTFFGDAEGALRKQTDDHEAPVIGYLPEPSSSQEPTTPNALNTESTTPPEETNAEIPAPTDDLPDTPAPPEKAPVSPPPPPPSPSPRQDRINDELRVEVKSLENFRLLQDQEWAELSHGIEQTEQRWKNEFPDSWETSIAKVRAELLDSLELSAKLKPDLKLDADPGYIKLRNELRAALGRPTE